MFGLLIETVCIVHAAALSVCCAALNKSNHCGCTYVLCKCLVNIQTLHSHFLACIPCLNGGQVAFASETLNTQLQ